MEPEKRRSPLTLIDDDIVISGIGGRYPESDSLDEFRDNLYNNVDMITEDDRRWPTALYGMNHRMGKLKQIDRFDAAFFGIVPKVADEVDPPGRILLETTWEAIVDAGVNPQSLRGSNTGVYVGYTSVAMPDGVPQEVQDDVQASKVESLLWFQGGSKAFYANRVSFLYDLHGPSMAIDVACASSMVCLDIAVTDMRLGKCDQAIVAGVSINLQPFTNHIYQVNSIAAPDGRPKVWDQDANGYVRGETVCSLFLQKASDSKRIYATILHTKSNIDGYKITGMFFPSSQSQYDLMVATYTEAGIDPLDVNYFESHGTGTKVGDPQEARAILEAYCCGRKGKLPIGLLKSNIGHGEGASGVASLSKLCIVYENKRIPANLNLKQIKSDIAVMCPPLDPVCENRDHEPGITGVNSFGIGGVNAHALMKPNKKECTDESYLIAEPIPRVVNVNGRTEESVHHILDFIERNPKRVTREFLALLGETVNYEPNIFSGGFPYRGSMLIQQDQSRNGERHYIRKVSRVDNAKRPVVFFFSGMGSQWSAMAKAMMNIELFAVTIHRCADVLHNFGLELEFILLSEDPKALGDKIHHFVAITSVQIALVDVFRAMNVEPDYIIGHSFGEIACAYADGCLTLEQAIVVSYWRGRAIKDSNIEHGMMAAVGLTWEETLAKCPPGVYAACHNSVDSVTISGAYDAVNACVRTLTKENIFAREVQCANIPFHSPLLDPATERMTKALQFVITEPKVRTPKWICTSLPESAWSGEMARTASPEYFVNNLINPVLFHDASQHLPTNAIVIELASHTLFSTIFKRSMPNCDYVGLMKRNNNAGNLEFYLTAIGQLYQLGVNIDLKPLYPRVEWPVPRNTQSISSLIRWEHSKSFLVKRYPEFHCQATASDFIQKFSLSDPDNQFLKDHAFDGRCIFPASSYLLLAWRRLAVSLGLPWFKFPVVFENVEFKRLLPVSEEALKLKVRLLDPTGEFVILDGEEVAATGIIRCPDEITFLYQDKIDHYKQGHSVLCGHKLNSTEFYTEMNVRGYDYGPKFKNVQEIEFESFEKSHSLVRWEGNFVTFLESLIQLYVSHTSDRLIYVASSLQSLKCDPKMFYDAPAGRDFPVITDGRLKYVASRGLELKGMKLANIPLKDVMRDVKMETYGFVPFDEPRAIEPIDLQELQQYIDQCETLAVVIGRQQKPSSQKLAQILQCKPGNDQVLLDVLIKMYHEMFDENANVRGDGKPRLPAAQPEKPPLDLSKDILNRCGYKNGRMMRSTLDVVNENSLRNMTIIEVNYSDSIMINDIIHYMSDYFHYPLAVDYLLATKDVASLPTSLHERGYELVDWNPKSSTLPTIENPANLFVYRDLAEDLSQLDFVVFAKEIAKNVRESGFLLAMFRSKSTKAERLIAALQGKLAPDDETLTKRIEEFDRKVRHAGFSLVSRKSDSVTTTCLMYRKRLDGVDPKKQTVVPVYFGRFDEWVDRLRIAFVEYKNRPKNESIWMVADDSSLNGILGMCNCLRQEPGGERFRCIFSFSKLPEPVEFSQTPYKDILEKDLAVNVFKDGQWGTYRMLDMARNYNIRQSDEAYFDIGKKGDLRSLKWINLSLMERAQPDTVTVDIHYAGLDYKDFLLCSGGLGVDFLKRSLGTEFSGRLAGNGKRVMGLVPWRAIATSIEIDPRTLVSIPDQWTLQDGAACINSLFLVWYSLVDQARIRRAETILIHPGTSDNGLTAIQVAAKTGCRILATAVTEQQRRYLTETCAVPAECIFNPAETDFADRVLAATGYQGVDVVFDNVSPRPINAQSQIIRDYGRYVEVDKSDFNLSKQKPRNVHYYNVSALIDQETFETVLPQLVEDFTKWFDQICSKYFKPITQTVFDRFATDQAFQTLQSEATIGKVLIKIRETDEPASKIPAAVKTYFNGEKCYILVGGLGGLGLEVAYWMVTRGARCLVLVSRSGIKNEYQYVFVKRIENAADDDVTVKISTCDPSTLEGAQQLIKEGKKLGPIGGIFHFATVLNDAFIEDQTPDSFRKVCRPKMDALGYIDAVTRQTCPDLDYFVAFSSQSSGRGFIGQCNYGYANSVMEHICENRQRDGLAGQAIEYGPIGDVGLWAQNEHIDLTAIGMVINTQRIPSCMEVLDRFLSLPYPVVSTIVRYESLQQNGPATKAKNQIWEGIGIDMDSLPDNLTLGDVGMESILAVEMQQRVEREYEVNLSTDEIKKLTVGMIKEYRNANKEAITQSLLEFRGSK